MIPRFLSQHPENRVCLLAMGLLMRPRRTSTRWAEKILYLVK